LASGLRDPYGRDGIDRRLLDASTLGRTQTPLGAFYRRIASRSGAGKAVVATAHKLARLIYTLLSTGEPYESTTLQAYDRQQHQRLSRSLARRAKALGYRIVPEGPSPDLGSTVS